MDETYTQTWSLEIEFTVNDLAVSADGRLVVIGADDGLRVANSQGNVLWSNNHHPVFAVSVSRDGEAIAADAGSKVKLFNRRGELLNEWEVYSIARGIVLTDTPPTALIASIDAIHCFPLQGEQPLWTYSWGRVGGICATPDGRLVIAGTEDGEILLLDETGGLIDLFHPGGDICSLAVNAQGESLVALDYEKGRVLLYDCEGTLLWEKSPWEEGSRQIAAVSMSGDGALIVLDLRNEVVLWDREGAELARYGIDESVQLAVINTEGTMIVIGGVNGRVVFQTSDPAFSAKAQSLLWEEVIRIRSEYLLDPAGGFCLWLDAFDRALLREQFDFCDGLLNEIESGYSLGAFEQAYVQSRRGALWLGRGIAHHRLGEYERAQECYQQGLRRHTEANNLEGEGQARLLLDLPTDSGAPEGVPRGFIAQLKALGSAEAFLTHQVENGKSPEQLAATLTAGRFGYLEPLLTALNRSDAVANNAVAALGSLNPGPNRDILVQAMAHPNWFVRWRAVSILRQRGEETTLPGLLSEAVRSVSLEQDPAVLRNLIRLIEQSGERDYVTAVIPLTLDSDAEVRHAVCRALAKIGDRRAIKPLEQTPQGYAFFDGGWVQEAASEALEEIRDRYPAPEVEEVALFRRFEDHFDAPLPMQVFPSATSTIYGRVKLNSHWRNVRSDLQHDPSYPYRIVLNLAGEDPGEDAERAFFFDEDNAPLVELLPEDDYYEAGKDDSNFSRIRCPLCRWQPDSSSLWICGGDGPPGYFEGCGTEWNTFDMHGRCPGCGHQWFWTACLSCENHSLHKDWYTNDDSEEVDEWGVSFLIAPPHNGWQAGIYELDVYLNGEPVAGHLFEIIEMAPIEQVAVAATSDDGLNWETDVILAGWNELSCIVTVNGFAGLRIEAQILDEARGLIVKAATRFTERDRQLWVRWPSVDLRSGIYTAVATSETGTRGECRFRVVESVQILNAHLARSSGSRSQSEEPVKEYLWDEDFALNVELSLAPAGFPVSVQWRHGSGSIGDGPATHITMRAGKQTAHFSLHPPDGEWPGGNYCAVIRLNDRDVQTISFKVIPPPPSQRLRGFTRKAFSFLNR